MAEKKSTKKTSFTSKEWDSVTAEMRQLGIDNLSKYVLYTVNEANAVKRDERKVKNVMIRYSELFTLYNKIYANVEREKSMQEFYDRSEKIMPRIDVKNILDNYHFNNCINYVAKSDHCIKGFIGATNLYLSPNREEHVPLLKMQIQYIRRFYEKNDTRLGIHVVVTFSPEEYAYLSRRSILEIGYYLAENEFSNCMTYFAVHDNTELLHLDMLIIPIDVHTGKMYGCGKVGWNCIELKLKSFLRNYVPESVIGSFQVAY